MCGFTGILHHGRVADAPSRTKHMADAIRHRGPDDEGFWSDGDVALGFRRLSIVDLETGHQPMSNEDGTIWVVFNGEIYNHRALRRELEEAGHRFATDHSDTEVLVHGYEQWGEGLLTRLNGMFGFAIWDSRNRRLMLGRDRLGIKPVYYAETPDGSLVFGSEIRALHASGMIEKAPDDQAVYAYFLQQNVWQGRTLFKNIRQLEGGHVLVDIPEHRTIQQFWDISFNRRSIAPAQAAEALRSTLQDSLERQLSADVPVMSYLSGGIDSSAIVAGAYRLDPEVKAYSCLFELEGVGDDRIVDEREFSRAVAAHLHIPHVEMELGPTALITSLHRTVGALEEPRMGMAYVNYLIAERVAADSKVVLSGCGGDEILGGYVGRYGHLRLPYPPAQAAQPASFLARVMRRLRPKASPDTMRDPLKRMHELYAFPVPPHEIALAFTPAFRMAAGDYSMFDALGKVLASCPSENDWDRLLYADAKTYLAGLLMVEDKLSMAHGLEARVPLLDNEMIDLALGYDWALLTDGEIGKKVFRDAVRDWVPPAVADKPKMGFGPPDASWYRGPLQVWIRSMLAPGRIAARGIFDPAFVAGVVESHMSGAANRLPLIWSLLSFEAWCEITGFYGGKLAGTDRAI
ncbi:MAG: asparagine synthase (glutamine-hydrolyzing) [Beijerinckiaceae bacterium]